MGSLGGVRGPHYCTICSVSTTSAVHLQTHYMGSKHQRRLAQARSCRDKELSPHYCDVCGISATSEVHLQLHLNGRAHQRKAKLAMEGPPDQPAGQPSCLLPAGTVSSLPERAISCSACQLWLSLSCLMPTWTSMHSCIPVCSLECKMADL